MYHNIAFNVTIQPDGCCHFGGHCGRRRREVLSALFVVP